MDFRYSNQLNFLLLRFHPRGGCILGRGTGSISIVKILLVAVLYNLGCSDDYGKWKYSQKIILNTSSTGININRNVYKIPVLIRLNPGNFRFFPQVKDKGADIRFAKADNTYLPYHIERWVDGSYYNDTADIWVLIDTVFGNNYSQSIIMYWGNDSAADSSNSASVFDTANGFVGVWHLNESPSGGAGAIKDATINALHATAKGGMGDTNLVAGIIGKAHQFDGVNDGDSIPYKPALNFSNAVTLSAWVNVSAFQSYSRIVSRGIPTNNDPWTVYSLNTQDTLPRLRGEISRGDSGSQRFVIGKSMSTNTWYHVALTYDRSTLRLYRNGLPDSVGTAATDLIGTNQTTPLMIGKANYGTNPFKGFIDEVRVEKIARDSNWIRLCFENQGPGQNFIVSTGEFKWDTSSNAGYQPGSGTWGKNNYWTLNGTQLMEWPGRGYWAMITGGVSGNYTITVDGTQYLDSLVVRTNTFTITSGTLDFGTKSGIHIPQTITTIIESVIAGSAGISKWGRGTLVLGGVNTFTGPMLIYAGVVSASNLADGGFPSSIGASGGSAANFMIDSGAFVYTGPAVTTDRLFSIGRRGGTITSSGTGALAFVNSGSMGFWGSGPRTLILDGTNTGENKIALAIGDSGGATSVVKQGNGKWILEGACTYTGATRVTAGTFIVNGSLAATSAVTVSPAAVIGGCGNIAGPITAKGATVVPGYNGAGKLSVGSLVLDSASILEFELGAKSDTISVAGDLTLDGTLNLIAGTGFGPGPYRIITYGGTLTNDTPIINAPMGRKCTLKYGSGYIDVEISSRIIQTEPSDTALLIGQKAVFKVSATGSPPISYLWQRSPGDSVGSDSVFSISSVSRADNGSYYRCIVKDAFESDTSRWALLTVLDTPRVKIQPCDTTLHIGDKAILSFTLEDSSRCSYKWFKTGSSTVLCTTITFTIETVSAADEGEYYCSITNPVATVNTNKIYLKIIPPPPQAAFGFAPRSGPAPLEVLFTDSSVGDISSRRWDFGDGKTDTVENPKHTYRDTGSFSVKLKVCGQGGCDSTIKRNAVYVYDSVKTDTSLQNALHLTKILYDSMNAAIRIYWCVDSARLRDNLELGIAYSLEEPVQIMNGRQIVSVYSACGDTVVRLYEQLRFDTVYHIAIFLRTAEGRWAPSTKATQGTVRIGSPFRQVVTVFDTTTHSDTVWAFNERVAIWRDTSYTSIPFITATLEVYKYTPPPGFVLTGMPFRFINAGPTIPFVVGIRINNLPEGTKASDVRIYRDSAGILTVDYSSKVNPEGEFVYVNTNNLDLPFIAMIDKKPPVIRLIREPDSIAYAERDLLDSVRISDNIYNACWRYLCGRGDEKVVPYDSGTLNDTFAVKRLIISSSSHIISSESGVRAILEVSDGVNRASLDLSRAVYREKSDPFTTSGQLWCPLYPTACLYQTDPESLIVLSVNNETGYDNRYMRLFRWVETAGNRSNDTNKWVEYNPDDESVRSLFAMVPGRMVWLKTLKNVPLHLGRGRTLSPADTFSVELAPKQFTDFGMPFRFGVYIKDILEASGAVADSIRFYIWSRDTVINIYSLDILYHPLMADKRNPFSVVKFIEGGGYSIYNPYNKPVVLKIPPAIADATSGTGSIMAAKKSKTPLWGALLVTKTAQGSDLPALYCGYAASVKIDAGPVSPAFHPVRIFIFDRGTGKKYGYYISGEASEGIAKEILFTNTSDSVQRINYRFRTAGDFPEAFSASLYDAASGKFSTEGSVSIEPRSAASRWFLTGDGEWYNDFMASVKVFGYGFDHIYPNPARSIVNFSFSVPFGAQEGVIVTVFDLKGRKVWEKKLSASLLTAGYHTVKWNGCNLNNNPLGAGRYPVRLTITDMQGKITQRFDRFLTYIP